MNWNWAWTTLASFVCGSGFTMLIQLTVSWRLEARKVHWGRASWVHQRQVDALARLYQNLRNMQDDLQGATRSGRLGNEVAPEEYMKHFYKDSASSWSEFIGSRLLLDECVIAKCDDLFNEFQEAQIALGAAKMLRGIGDGTGSAEQSSKATEIAHKHIPALLREIEQSARQIIHLEATAV